MTGVRLTLGLLVLVLAGCGANSHAEVAVPPGFTLRTVDEPAFSIALPKEWRSFDKDSHASDDGDLGPRLRAGLRALEGSNAPIKLIGLARVRGVAFVPNMNVIQTRVPEDLTFEQFADREARQLRAAAGVRDLSQRELRLPAGRALRLTYRTRTNMVLQQYYVLHRPFLYVLTYTRPPAGESRYAKIFDLSAHTFQLQ